VNNEKGFLTMQLVDVVFLSSFKVLFVTAPGKENFNVTHDVVVAALVA
jgi:hypothetical protein